jgi:hypothetical protein
MHCPLLFLVNFVDFFCRKVPVTVVDFWLRKRTRTKRAGQRKRVEERERDSPKYERKRTRDEKRVLIIHAMHGCNEKM